MKQLFDYAPQAAYTGFMGQVGGDPTYCHVLARRRFPVDLPLFEPWIQVAKATVQKKKGPPYASMGILNTLLHLKQTFGQDVLLLRAQLIHYIAEPDDPRCSAFKATGIKAEEAKGVCGCVCYFSARTLP